MKKLFTFILTAAMAVSLSVPVFAEEPAKAAPSGAKVAVNGVEIAPQAYIIDGYTYFKLRDVGDALGFEVTWDNTAKRIGINADDISYEVSFENCVFEKGLKVISDRNTNVVLNESCVFAEGTGVVVEEATEGNHLTMKMEDPFVRINHWIDGLNVTTDDIVSVYANGAITSVLNGTVYTADDFENINSESDEVSGYAVAYYYENGEAAVVGEAW